MNVPLDKILPSPHPLRTSWDEDKMAELAQSVKEQGIIVPIKVRPTDSDLCEIVYGHRRVEAARRAGLSEIPAIVEGVEDTDALIQALIENVQREDMEPIDTARALQALKDETGWSNVEIERRGIMKDATVGDHLRLLRLPEDVQSMISSGREHRSPEYRDKVLTPEHVTKSSILREDERPSVLRKAAKEKLTTLETRSVAESIAAAEDDAEREAILETDYHDPAFHRLVRVKSEVKRETVRREQKQRQENPREVKEYIEAVQAFSAAVQIAIKVAEFGKFSPEAGRFITGWHDSIREGLARLEEIWEDNNA